ncbi:MAG: hypothetical protein AAGK32_11830, partial [Actinomycetota bacterium]
MSRQVFLVFFGPERWRDLPGPDDVVDAAEGEDGEAIEGGAAERLVGPGPDHEPHESPWTMTTPLVVLSLLAATGGLVNLTVSDDLKQLEHWLEPLVETAEAHLTLSTTAKIVLAVLATIAGVIGIAAAFAVYLRKRVDAAR